MENGPTASHGTAPLKVLLLSSLFPSDARPRHGIFVETRMQQLRADCPVDVRVVAPVPWFPSRSSRFGRYAEFAATPRHAVRSGVPVSYPRYAMLPKLGVSFQAAAMALAATREIAALARSGWVPDVIDSHYFYPDGVAAARIGLKLDIPVVITARGSDVNLLAGIPGPRQQILWAAHQASAVVAVSRRLRDSLVAMGVAPDHVTVLRNGVDLERFVPLARDQARRELDLPADGLLAACVGNLVPEKGQALAIDALQHLPGWRLLIVGNGPLRDSLESVARQRALADRVIFRPTMPQASLRWAYSAADALLLTSTREGWPNVVLESLACGTPVVATDVGAVSEMLSDEQFGRVLVQPDAAQFAAAVEAVAAAVSPRERLREHAAGFGWRNVSLGQWELFRRVLQRGAATAKAGIAATEGRTT